MKSDRISFFSRCLPITSYFPPTHAPVHPTQAGHCKPTCGESDSRTRPTFVSARDIRSRCCKHTEAACVCVCVCKRRRCRHTRLPQSAGISFRASLVANVQRVALVSFIAIYARAYRHASVIGLSGCSNHS